MKTNKFNGTNYNDWLRNLRIVLDFENQGYVLEKPLPTTLLEGSLPKEHVTFKKWPEDNRKKRLRPPRQKPRGPNERRERKRPSQPLLAPWPPLLVRCEWAKRKGRLGHISEDRMRKSVDSKSLESALANSLLDLIHTDVYGPLNTLAIGGYSYFIIFIDDCSWYGYVYLMSYKSEAFEKFKEYRLEVEIKLAVKSKPFDRTEARMPQTPYEIWHGKPASYKCLRVWGSPAYVKRLVGDKLDSRFSLCSVLENGFPTDSRRDEVLLEETSEAPQHNNAISFEPIVSPIVFQFCIGRPENRDHLIDRRENDTSQQFHLGKDLDGSAEGFHFCWRGTESLSSLKDMGEVSYILGIKICRDRSRRMLRLTQSSYIKKVLKRFKMENSKRGFLPMRHGIKLSKNSQD
ncbi:hypothetical protein Sango_2484300 [Sesamum angolense]|uniref:Uncharacterized protein n=1 Tax=Sesamum angolense TaxID=2727404 RepID=A0AAE1W3N5_9LAMI|nr:hypothetical protein Sango_2484300 [Sesamum angolense]